MNSFRNFAHKVSSAALVALLCACSREPLHEGRPFSAWLDDAGSASEETRSKAFDAFRKMGDAAPPRLSAVIRDAHLDVSDETTEKGARAQRAFNVLMQLSPENHAATDALVELLRDYDAAGDAALYLAGTSPSAFPLLTNALTAPERRTRVAVTAALGTMTNLTPEVVPVLLRALRDEHYTARAMAAASLAGFEPTPEVVAALTEHISDRSQSVRLACARSLGKFGPAAKSAVPTLLKAAENRPDSIREGALEALKKISPESVPK